MRLLLDENLSPQQSAILREQGHDAVAVVDAGLSGQPDEKIREFAIADNRALLTLDSDFANMLRFPTAGTPGVIRLKIHPPTEQGSSRADPKNARTSQGHAARRMPCRFARGHDPNSELTAATGVLRVCLSAWA